MAVAKSRTEEGNKQGLLGNRATTKVGHKRDVNYVLRQGTKDLSTLGKVGANKIAVVWVGIMSVIIFGLIKCHR